MKRLLLVFAVMVVAVVMATGASAIPTATVNIFPCAFGGGATVGAGLQINLTATWTAKTRGLTNSFLDAVTTFASVNSTPVANANSYFSAPTGDNTNGWLTRWTYPTGITLAAGQTMTVSFDWVLAYAITDGFKNDNKQSHIGPGSVFGGPLSCTITAV